jgi:hypothetical protein
MELKFPYVFLRGEFYPMIPVNLKKNERSIETLALIDSGATISVFQGSLGESLGIDLESGKKKLFQGIGGKIIGYIHSVVLKIANLEFDCEVAFSYELATSMNILGRKGFFDKFLLTFDEQRKEVILKPKDDVM